MSQPTYSEDDREPGPATAAPVGAARFQLGREIGKGGMGRVVEALDRQFDRSVAVKMLLGRDGSGRFESEARVTGRLQHPAIPAVYERGTLPDGTPFYAMQLAEGRTLDQALSAALTLEERVRLLPVLVQVAHALGYAHERGVVHRDVKPQNIVVGDHGRVFLLDWGIAKIQDRPTIAPAESSGDGHQTMQGSVMGTPAYMAPEQARGDVEHIDARTDVFALGAVLYHVLAGRSPYVGETAEIALSHAVEARWEPLKTAAPKAPHGLHVICERAMAPNPGDRYANALELSAAIHRFQASALLARDGGRVEQFTSFSTIAVLGVLCSAAIVTWQMLPGLQAQGAMAYGYLATFGLGWALWLVEWRTRGRYALEPLLLVLALLTILLGVAGTGVNLVAVSMALQRPEFSDPETFKATALMALAESLGNVPASALFAGIQLVLWGMRRRARMRQG